MDPNDPRDYRTRGLFKQTASAEALIRFAVMQRELKHQASIIDSSNEENEIRELLISDNHGGYSRVIVHFKTLEKSKQFRVESLYIVGPEVQISAEELVKNPQGHYHRSFAVPIGDYTEEQTQKKLEYIANAYDEAMKQAPVKRAADKPAEAPTQGLEEKIEDPLDIMNIELDLSQLQGESVTQPSADKPDKLQQTIDEYLEGKDIFGKEKK